MDAATQDKLAKYVQLGAKHHQAGEWEQSAKYYVKAWDIVPEDSDLLVIISHLMVQLGVRDKAVLVLEKAFEKLGPTRDVLSVMGDMCQKLGMLEQAEKLYRIFIEAFPDDYEAYAGYSNILGLLRRNEEAIEFLQAAIPRFADRPELWNILGTQLAHTRRYEEAMVFYDEALRLNPKAVSAINNKAIALNLMGRPDEKMALMEKAHKINPKNHEIRTSLAFDYFRIGDIKKAWKLYESRLVKDNNALIYTLKAKPWRGQDISKKTLFIHAEQGVGDEILFAMIYAPLVERAQKTYIGCDRRLVPAFQRAFPNCEIYAHNTGLGSGYLYRSYTELEYKIRDGEANIDYALEAGVAGKIYARKTEDFPIFENGFFKGNDDDVAKWRKIFNDMGPEKKVGVAWTSSKSDAYRDTVYFNLETMLPIIKTKGVKVIALQYTDCDEEIAAFEKKHGIQIYKPDIDLRNNLEEQFAIMQNLDIMIGAGISTTMFAASTGIPTWWLCFDRVWWNFGSKYGPPMVPNAIYTGYDFGTPWGDVMNETAKRLEKFLETGDAKIGHHSVPMD